MKDRNTSWVKYAFFLTFLALILSALVFWLCAYLDSQSDKAPSDPTPPIEDGSEFPDGSAIVPDGSEKPNVPNPPTAPDGSEKPNIPNDPDGSDIINGSEDTEILDPNDVYIRLRAELMQHYNIRITERKDFISKELVQQTKAEATTEKIADLLGEPHFYSHTFKAYPQHYQYFLIYVLDDGTVCEVANNQYVYQGDLENYFMFIEEEWDNDIVTEVPPSETWEKLSAEFDSHTYITVSERTDFVNVEKAKTVASQGYHAYHLYSCSFDQLTEWLGEPHFMQLEEQRRPASNNPRWQYWFYILEDGTVLKVNAPVAEIPGNMCEMDFYLTDDIIYYIQNFLYY